MLAILGAYIDLFVLVDSTYNAIKKDVLKSIGDESNKWSKDLNVPDI